MSVIWGQMSGNSNGFRVQNMSGRCLTNDCRVVQDLMRLTDENGKILIETIFDTDSEGEDSSTAAGVR